MFCSSILQEYSGKWITNVFTGCTPCNIRVNVLHHDRAPPHSGREKRISDYEGRWRGLAWHSQSPNLNPLYLFLWVWMKLRVYHGGKPKRSNHTTTYFHTCISESMRQHHCLCVINNIIYNTNYDRLNRAQCDSNCSTLISTIWSILYTKCIHCSL